MQSEQRATDLDGDTHELKKPRQHRALYALIWANTSNYGSTQIGQLKQPRKSWGDFVKWETSQLRCPE